MLVNIIKSIEKVFAFRNACEDVNDDNLSEKLHLHALVFGLQGFKNYTQASETLCITKSYLYHLISVHREERSERKIRKEKE